MEGAQMRCVCGVQAVKVRILSLSLAEDVSAANKSHSESTKPQLKVHIPCLRKARASKSQQSATDIIVDVVAMSYMSW